MVHCGNLYDHILFKNETQGNSNSLIKTMCEIYNFGNCYEGLRLNDIITYGKTSRPEICEGFHTFPEQKFDGTEINSENLSILNNLMAQLTADDLLKIAHQPNQLIRSCTFSGMVDVGCYNFQNGSIRLINPLFGVCYSFNYHPPKKFDSHIPYDPKITSFSGQHFGLELEIDVESNFGLRRDLASATGIRFLLHAPRSYPMITSQGMDLKTNTLTKVSLELNQIQRRPSPYESNCTNTWSNEETYNSVRHMPYQRLLCESICIDDIIQELCNCTYIGLIEFNRKLSPACDFFIDKEYFECIENISLNQEYYVQLASERCSSCSPECEEEVYKPTISQSTWPSPLYGPVLAAKYKLMLNNTLFSTRLHSKLIMNYSDIDSLLSSKLLHDTALIQRLVEESFLKVSVFFESRSILKIEETPKYFWNSFLSSIGGSLSLYLGINFVSYFELMEFFIRLVLG